MLESVWDTEIHCAVRAGDEADNWSQVSNIVTRILPPRPTTTTPVPVTSELNLETKEILELIRRGHIHNITSIKNIQVRTAVMAVKELVTIFCFQGIHDLLKGLGRTGTEATNSIYIATGVMTGVVAVIVIMLLVMIYRNRRKAKLVQEPVSSSFPISDIRVRAESSESPTLIHSSKLSSADGSSKVLLNWLEDLSNHSHNTPGHLAVSGHNPEPVHIPGHSDTLHNTSHNTPARSPQRQRMLTNGSFVKVKTPLTLNASKLHLEYL